MVLDNSDLGINNRCDVKDAESLEKVQWALESFGKDIKSVGLEPLNGGYCFKVKVIDNETGKKYSLIKIPIPERAERVIKSYNVLKRITQLPEYCESVNDGFCAVDDKGHYWFLREFFDGATVQDLVRDYFASMSSDSFEDFVKKSMGLERLFFDDFVENGDYYSPVMAQIGFELGNIFDKTKEKVESLSSEHEEYFFTLATRLGRVYGRNYEARAIRNYHTSKHYREFFTALQMCDVKPDNFLICSDGRVRIIDLDSFRITDGIFDLMFGKNFLTMNNSVQESITCCSEKEENDRVVFGFPRMIKMNDSLTSAQTKYVFQSVGVENIRFFNLAELFEGLSNRNMVVESLKGSAPPFEFFTGFNHLMSRVSVKSSEKMIEYSGSDISMSSSLNLEGRGGSHIKLVKVGEDDFLFIEPNHLIGMGVLDNLIKNYLGSNPFVKCLKGIVVAELSANGFNFSVD